MKPGQRSWHGDATFSRWARFSLLLRDAGLTRKDLAARLGISMNAVSRWPHVGVPEYAFAYLRAKLGRE